MKDKILLLLILLHFLSCFAKTDANGQELPKWYDDNILPYERGEEKDSNRIPLPKWLEAWKVENQDPPPEKYTFSNHNIFDFPPTKKVNKLEAVISPAVKFETIKDDIGNEIPAWKKEMDEKFKKYELLNNSYEPKIPQWANTKKDSEKKDANGTILPNWYK